MVKCSSDTDKAHISESSATVIVVLLLLQYHCPPNLELHQHLSRACAGRYYIFIISVGGGRVVRWCWVPTEFRGVLLIWIKVGKWPTVLVVGAGGVC